MISLLDTNDLLGAIKKAAVDAVDTSKPVTVHFGKVISTNPMRINVEQKLTLEKEQLIFTKNVSKSSFNGFLHAETSTAGSDLHSHIINAPVSIGLQNQLVVGDTVLLLRIQGGQKYVVMDRIGNFDPINLYGGL